MAYSANDVGISNGKVIGVITGAFAAFAIGLLVLLLVSAPFIGDVPTDPATGEVGDTTAAAATVAVAVAIVPFIAFPILSTIMGVWTGSAQRDAGSATWTSAVGVLAGIIVFAILLTIAVALANLFAGASLQPTIQNAFEGQQQTFLNIQYFLSAVGLAYLLANLVMAAIAAAITAWILPDREYVAGTAEDRRVVT